MPRVARVERAVPLEDGADGSGYELPPRRGHVLRVELSGYP